MKSIKFSSILLIIGLLSLVLAIFLSNAILRNQTAQIDLNNTMRNYEKIDLEQFDQIVLETSRIMDENELVSLQTQISQDATPSMFVLKQLKDSIQWKIENKVLYVKGCYAELAGYQPFSIKIMTSSLASVISKSSHFSVNELTADSLYLECQQKGNMVIDRITAQKVNIKTTGNASLDFKGTGTIDQLHLDLDGESVATLSGTINPNFTYKINPAATLTLKGDVIALLKKN